MELEALKKPRIPHITEELLNQYEAHVQSEELREIARIAQIGLWALSHSKALKDSLLAKMVTTPMAEISKYEKALDALPLRLK